MPRSRHRDLRFPLAGVDRRRGFQNQRPFTTIDAMNVRPDGTLEQRERGGSRPGLERPYATSGSLGNTPVRMLASVPWAPQDRLAYWFDEFNYATSSALTGAGWKFLPASSQEILQPGNAIGYERGDILSMAAPPLRPDDDAPYAVELTCRVTEEDAGFFIIYLLMDNADPDPRFNSVAVHLFVNEFGVIGAFNSRILALNDRVTVIDQPGQAGTQDFVPVRVLKAVLTGTLLDVFWGDVHIVDGLSVGSHPGYGQRIGFGMIAKPSLVPPTQDFSTLWVDRMSMRYTDEAAPAKPVQPVLMVSVGGDVHYETAEGVLAPVTAAGGLDVSSTKLLHAAAHDQVLYIADYGDTLAEDREPKLVQYNTDTNTWELKVWEATIGTLPQDCPIIAMWGDRIYLAGKIGFPHLFFASKRGDPFNWDYSEFVLAQDSRESYAGSATNAGLLGQPITALIPYSADYLIVGGTNSLWVMRGDLASGGGWDNISRTIGILSQAAWCPLPGGGIAYLSADGLYVILATPGAEPESLSRERLPKKLIDIDPANIEVLLAYDVQARGIHIYLSSRGGPVQEHWWFDWETKGFWPLVLPRDQEPLAILSRQSTDASYPNGVFLGCRDGVLRKHSKQSTFDDSVPFDSHVLYGPIPISGNDHEDGLLLELVATLALNSGNVEWSAHVGESPEAAAKAPAFDSGVWHEGLNHTNHPHAGGNAFYLRLQSTHAWAVESIDALTMKTGKQKLP